MVEMLKTTIFCEDGSTVEMGSIVDEPLSCVVFLRQGECIECTMLVHELQTIYTELSDWNVPLRFIANGTLDSLPKLRKKLGFSKNTMLYTDPSLSVYRNAGLEYGLYRSFGPQALFNIGKGLFNGFMQTRLGNNLPQQSGVFLFGEEQKIIWSHKSRHIGDLLDVNSLLEQILIHKSTGGQK